MRVIDTRVSVPFDQRIKDADAPTDTDEQIARRQAELARTIGENEARRDNGNTLVNPPTSSTVEVSTHTVKRRGASVFTERDAVWIKGAFNGDGAVEVERSANEGLAIVWLWHVGADQKVGSVHAYFRATPADLRDFATELNHLADDIDGQ